ncbi:hypothetical protein OG884_21175 [Streptosporangium sp. NBC_01755]|nr:MULTISPECIES: hypothetical protein [unclassified Streptosporangium]WSA24522.1 hypothetical protein OIE13_26750 [Streptosporangium sp. NBC_01810]WSC97404.1 hypothetical protein OG884_21175 [Streptosporangium sp. NBC_01755]
MDHHNTQHSVSVAGVIIDDQGRALLTQFVGSYMKGRVNPFPG